MSKLLDEIKDEYLSGSISKLYVARELREYGFASSIKEVMQIIDSWHNVTMESLKKKIIEKIQLTTDYGDLRGIARNVGVWLP